MTLFNIFKRDSRLTPNQKLDLKRTNIIRQRTGQSLLNEREYLAIVERIDSMKIAYNERYQVMYSQGSNA